MLRFVREESEASSALLSSLNRGVGTRELAAAMERAKLPGFICVPSQRIQRVGQHLLLGRLQADDGNQVARRVRRERGVFPPWLPAIFARRSCWCTRFCKSILPKACCLAR